MHGLILTSLAVFFLWHAGLKGVIESVNRYVPHAVLNAAQYAAVAAMAWLLRHLAPPGLTWALAVGGTVALVNGLLHACQVRAEAGVPRRPGQRGFR